MSIRSLLLVASLTFSGLPLAGVAHADGIKPVQAVNIDLGGVAGNAYYTVERDGFRVVTTLSQGDAATPIRMVAVLASGQSLMLSAANEAGLEPVEVEIAREADVLLVRKAALAY